MVATTALNESSYEEADENQTSETDGRIPIEFALVEKRMGFQHFLVRFLSPLRPPNICF